MKKQEKNMRGYKYDKNGFPYREISNEEAKKLIEEIENNDIKTFDCEKVSLEEINGMKVKPKCEKYLSKMYPIRILFDKYVIQRISEERIGRLLTDKEVGDLEVIFVDNYPLEIEIFIGELIEENFNEDK